MAAIAGLFKKIVIIFLYSGVLFGLYLAGRYNFLLFHSLAEFFSIVVACGIFIVAWNSRQFLENHYLLFIGIACLFVAGMDLVHTMAYKGMGIFPGYDANLPTQLWIAGRYIQGTSMLAAPIFINRKINISVMFFLYFLVCALMLWLIFSNLFPVCFIEGKGLTPFKKASEYGVALMFCASIIAMIIKQGSIDERVVQLICASFLAGIFSELCFTLYTDPYELSNQLGHVLKIISYCLIYNALIARWLRHPYNMLFKELKGREQELSEARGRLEIRVEERTVELVRTNKRLEREIADRKQAEERLLRYRYNLEDMIRQRTSELTRRNIELREEAEERKQAEQALIKQKEELQVVLDSVPALIFYKNMENRLIKVNKNWIDGTGFSEHAVIGKPLHEVFPRDQAEAAYKDDLEVISSGKTKTGIIEVLETRSGPRWFLTDKVPCKDKYGNIAGVIGFSRDITERKKAEERIRASLREKEAMLSEIHHRVKNNMQVISSLLSLQSRHAGKRSCDEVFRDCRRRIQSMALIHETLYQSGRLAGMDFGEYVHTLIWDLVRSYGMDTSRIGVNTEVHDVFLNIDRAVPCGLIINELVTNSIKHAFPDGRKGQIHVAIHPEEDKFVIDVKDDGIGLSGDFNIENENTLGIKLVKILVEQLEGALSIDGHSGADVHIVF